VQLTDAELEERRATYAAGFLMTPTDHRARAAQLRAFGGARLEEFARGHDQVALMIERRLGAVTPRVTPPVCSSG
jgi:hypothetical protein